jgi:hypothetical protein
MPPEVNPRFPFYESVPKDRRANLQWRLAVRKRSLHDREFQADLRQMCADDPLFFIAAFCYVIEPRGETGTILPFIPWAHQEGAIEKIVAALGLEDIGIEKSRAEGATWIILCLFLWLWLLRPMCFLGLVSKDEESVDSKDKPGSLMNKLDWLLTMLPSWLVPKGFDPSKHRNRAAHTLVNPENGSTFSGFAATGTIASGDRLTAILMDELSKFGQGKKGADYKAMTSVQAVTNCRIIVATPFGDSGAYYDIMHEEGSSLVKIVLDWKDNPVKRRGLYKLTKDGHVTDLNPQCPLTKRQREELRKIHENLRIKGHQVEEKIRSPWYDRECLRPNATPISIAQEQDRDYGRSSAKLFDVDTIDGLITSRARLPLKIGRLKINEAVECHFQEASMGNVQLWCPLVGASLSPSRRRYCGGADLGGGLSGSHTSNSVLIIVDMHTGEQVFELVSSSIKPTEFARISVAVAKWFWDAILNWDNNGIPGGHFTQEVERLEYTNFISCEVGSSGPDRKPAKKPGTVDHSPEAKAAYLNAAIEDMISDQLIIRSAATIREFSEFGWKGDKIVHVRSTKTGGDGATGKAHGDRATAAALCNLVRREYGYNLDPVPDKPPGPGAPLQKVPWPCAANRLLAHNERTKVRAEQWF